MGRAAPPANRIAALDLARGFAVWFMISVHVLQEWGSEATNTSALGRVVTFLGSPPAAPVFMFLMGASLAFSRRAGVPRMAWRGLQLLALGYGLNAFRGAIPAWIGLRLGVVDAATLGPYTPWDLLWEVDILEFAGVALFLLAAVRRLWPERVAVWLGLAAVIGAVGPLLWGTGEGTTPLYAVLRNLWGTGVHVSFPLFPWLAYPLVGMAWGRWLSDAGEGTGVVNGFFRKTLGVGVGLLAAGTAVCLTDPALHIGDYWRSGPGGVVWILGFVLAWVAICHFLMEKVRDNKVFGVLRFWSRNVTRFYVIQWLLVGWGAGAVGYKALGVPGTILALAVAPILAHGMTFGWARWRDGRAGEG